MDQNSDRSWKSMRRRVQRGMLCTYVSGVFRGPLWDGRSVPSPRGRYGSGPQPVLPFLLLGDSSAVTVGVLDRMQTLGAQLAGALAEELSCAVGLEVPARAGATSAGMERQLKVAVSRPGSGVALILIGGNDVMLPMSLRRSANRLGDYVRQLRAAGWQVVVGSCADMGAAPGVRVGAAALATVRSRRLARRQASAVLAAGGLVVSLTTDAFRDRPEELYCPDGFHPSAEGYAHYFARLRIGVLEAGRISRCGQASGVAGDVLVECSGRSFAPVVREPGACFVPVEGQVVMRRYLTVA